MQIEERSAGDVTILDLKGKMTLGEGDEILKDKINSLVLQGKKKLVLNLADVPYIDSAGLGEIVRTYTTVSRQGGSLKLLSLTKRITDLLSITKPLTVFETYDPESDALPSLPSSPPASPRSRAPGHRAARDRTVGGIHLFVICRRLELRIFRRRRCDEFLATLILVHGTQLRHD